MVTNVIYPGPQLPEKECLLLWYLPGGLVRKGNGGGPTPRFLPGEVQQLKCYLERIQNLILAP